MTVRRLAGGCSAAAMYSGRRLRRGFRRRPRGGVGGRAGRAGHTLVPAVIAAVAAAATNWAAKARAACLESHLAPLVDMEPVARAARAA